MSAAATTDPEAAATVAAVALADENAGALVSAPDMIPDSAAANSWLLLSAPRPI